MTWRALALGFLFFSACASAAPAHKALRVVIAAADAERIPMLQQVAPKATFLIARDGQPTPRDIEIALGVCSESLLSTSPHLKWIQVLATGADACLGVPGVRERTDLTMTAMQGTTTPAVADHVLALMLAHTRLLPTLVERQREEQWKRAAPDIAGLDVLDGKTILIAGLGAIGTEVARRAQAFGMTVIATRASDQAAPPFVRHVGRPDELNDLAKSADFIVNATPLTDATRGIFDARFFRGLKPTAFFINIGRGPSVVTDDLVRALQEHRLAGAGLDVFDPQPLPPNHPLWHMPGVIITPQIAGYTDDLWDRRWLLVRDNLRRYVAGEPLTLVLDRTRGY
jgi:D-2-hydroxyacid dehydrogenase (NADP+)